MSAQLLKNLTNFDVISFDVFDTLLLRPYLAQEDLWLDLGQKELGEKDGMAFLRARIAADKKTYEAATRRGGEHKLEEAYAMMPRRYAKLQTKEEMLQRDCLVANPETLVVWRRAGELGKKRIIVSDMYLSESWFAETLKEKGFGEYDALYVSSARQARKATGKLYEVVKRDFVGARILHIGDNEHSDVKMAGVVGVPAHHYLNLRDEIWGICPFLKAYLSEWPSQRKRLQIGALVRGYKLAEGSNKGYWWRLGYFFGGALGHLYVTWLAETARERGITHLMFVARDGYLWKKMFDSLNTGIKTDYFYAPRLTSVKVCGVIGCDPVAVAERQRILDSLPGNDPAAESSQYRTYIQGFQVDERTAIVDGCSSAFSVQRLVEKTVGHQVETFYLATLHAAQSNGNSLFPCGSNLIWQQLAEYIFSSPERPIEGLDNLKPRYCRDVADAELFRESIFAEIEKGAMDGFGNIHDLVEDGRAVFSKQDWCDYYAAFQSNLTLEDMGNLDHAKNARRIEQSDFRPIMEPQRIGVERVSYRLGIPIGTWYRRLTPTGINREFKLLNRWNIKKVTDKISP